MIFASKTPRDLNHDPAPWINEDDIRERRPDYVVGQYPHREPIYDPRPEFDHVQHNEPNPVLVAFRLIDGNRKEYADWVRDFDAYPEFWQRQGGQYPQYTPDQVDHARRVLSRLARLTEGAPA